MAWIPSPTPSPHTTTNIHNHEGRSTRAEPQHLFWPSSEVWTRWASSVPAACPLHLYLNFGRKPRKLRTFSWNMIRFLMLAATHLCFLIGFGGATRLALWHHWWSVCVHMCGGWWCLLIRNGKGGGCQVFVFRPLLLSGTCLLTVSIYIWVSFKNVHVHKNELFFVVFLQDVIKYHM